MLFNLVMVGEAQPFTWDMIRQKNQFKDPVPTKDPVKFLTGTLGTFTEGFSNFQEKWAARNNSEK